MFEPQRRSLVVALCLALSFWLPTAPVKAHAAQPSCSSREGKVRNLNLSSEVGHTSVKLCANWLLKIKSSSTKTVSKPSNPIKKPARGVSKPRKGDIIIKTKTGPKIIFKNSVNASPSPPKILQSRRSAETGDEVSFDSLARTHIRYRALLGVPTEIKFRPVSSHWKVDEMSMPGGRTIRQRFSRSGTHRVQLSVTYAISFRVWMSGRFRALSRTITLSADPVDVLVGNHSSPRFVWYTCAEKPNALGCLG